MTHADTEVALLTRGLLDALREEAVIQQALVDHHPSRPRDTFQDRVRDARVQLVVEILELLAEQRRLYALCEKVFPLDDSA